MTEPSEKEKKHQGKHILLTKCISDFPLFSPNEANCLRNSQKMVTFVHTYRENNCLVHSQEPECVQKTSPK